MQPEKVDFSVELRLNNTMFHCAICEHWHNITKEKAYAVQLIRGIGANKDIQQPIVILDSAIVCSKCYENPDYAFVEPSPIIIPKLNEEKLAQDVLSSQQRDGRKG